MPCTLRQDFLYSWVAAVWEAGGDGDMMSVVQVTDRCRGREIQRCPARRFTKISLSCGVNLDADSTTEEGRRTSRRRISFSISNLLLLIALIAVCIAWWRDHNRERPRRYDIQGPISVSYTVRTSPTSTAGSRIKGVRGIDFQGASIAIHTLDGGIVLPSSRLISLRWNPE